MEGDLKQQEICKIFAGEKQSFAVTRQGRIFCWGSNENNLLGLNLTGHKSGNGEEQKDEQADINNDKIPLASKKAKKGEEENKNGGAEESFYEP